MGIRHKVTRRTILDVESFVVDMLFTNIIWLLVTHITYKILAGPLPALHTHTDTLDFSQLFMDCNGEHELNLFGINVECAHGASLYCILGECRDNTHE